jgi:hypothetical protein
MRFRQLLSSLCFTMLLVFGVASTALADTTDFSAGSRTDNLNWNIAGNLQGTTPNVLSELKWTDLKIFELKLHNRHDLNDKSFLDTSLGYGWIRSGKNQDSDYNLDNRQGEFSRSNNNSSGDHVTDGSIAYGYYLVKQDKTKTAALAGYAVNQQDLRITNGYQTIGGTIGPFSGLNSTYDARWNGPFVGISHEQAASDKLSFIGRIEYHFSGKYRGEGNWNLRTDLANPSFIDTSDANGTVFSLGAIYKIDDSWKLQGGFSYSKFKASDGIKVVNFSNGTTASTKLNEVNWNSTSYTLSVTKAF